jgi:cephalosporin hydroxylase
MTAPADGRRIVIDLDAGHVELEIDGQRVVHALASPEGFAAASRAWLRAGWDAKYVYSFSWLGRPIIQLPEDMIRIQEVIWSLKPDVIIETGVAHGGALVFYATLCKAADRGRVIGVDVEIKPHNRRAIEAHPLSPYISLVEGNSIDPATVDRVRSQVRDGEQVLVTLDSNHTKEHVLAELEAYAPLVTEGSYIVVMDGIMEELAGAPRSAPDWGWNNPRQATIEFASRSEAFVVEEPAFAFNEGCVGERVTYWPGGFLRRVARP